MLSKRNTHDWLWFLMLGVVSALIAFSSLRPGEQA
jgi:hypothetical protein